MKEETEAENQFILYWCLWIIMTHIASTFGPIPEDRRRSLKRRFFKVPAEPNGSFSGQSTDVKSPVFTPLSEPLQMCKQIPQNVAKDVMSHVRVVRMGHESVSLSATRSNTTYQSGSRTSRQRLRSYDVIKVKKGEFGEPRGIFKISPVHYKSAQSNITETSTSSSRLLFPGRTKDISEEKLKVSFSHVENIAQRTASFKEEDSQDPSMPLDLSLSDVTKGAADKKSDYTTVEQKSHFSGMIPLSVARASPEPETSGPYSIADSDDETGGLKRFASTMGLLGSDGNSVTEEEYDMTSADMEVEGSADIGMFTTDLADLLKPISSPFEEDHFHLGIAELESYAKKSPLPLVKDDLRHKILQKHGHSPPKEWTEYNPNQPEDPEMLEKRRRINREAAKRSRDKLKMRYLELRQEVFELQSLQTQLTYQRDQLREEKARLKSHVDRHRELCPELQKTLTQDLDTDTETDSSIELNISA